MRRPPGPRTTWRQTSPTPLPEAFDTSMTPDLHWVAVRPSWRNRKTSSTGRRIEIVRSALGTLASVSCAWIALDPEPLEVVRQHLAPPDPVVVHVVAPLVDDGRD